MSIFLHVPEYFGFQNNSRIVYVETLNVPIKYNYVMYSSYNQICVLYVENIHLLSLVWFCSNFQSKLINQLFQQALVWSIQNELLLWTFLLDNYFMTNHSNINSFSSSHSYILEIGLQWSKITSRNCIQWTKTHLEAAYGTSQLHLELAYSATSLQPENWFMVPHIDTWKLAYSDAHWHVKTASSATQL